MASSSSYYYRILKTEDGYSVKKMSESLETQYSFTDYALPVKIYNEKIAQEIYRKITYGNHDELFCRGVAEGILLMNQDSVEFEL